MNWSVPTVSQHFFEQSRLAEPGTADDDARNVAWPAVFAEKACQKANISSRPMKGVKPRREVASNRRVTVLRRSTTRACGIPDAAPDA